MLRRRITNNEFDESGEKIYKNYITATYDGSSVKLLGDAYDIKQIETIVFNKNELGPVKTYNFGSEGQHTVKIVVKPMATTCMYMFDNCVSLKSFDLSNFDMSNVNSAKYMFRKTDGLLNVTIADMNWSKMTSAYGMFDSSSKLENITFKNIKSPLLNSLGFAFNWTSLKTCDLTGLDLSNVTDMSGLFKDNWWLKTLRISSSVSKVNNITEMFARVNTIGDFYYSKKYGKGIIKKPWLWTEHAV